MSYLYDRCYHDGYVWLSDWIYLLQIEVAIQTYARELLNEQQRAIHNCSSNCDSDISK